MDPSLRAKPLKVIIIAGIIAGTLDIIAACVHYYIVSDGKNPDVVLKFIASGVFGPRQAFSGGFIMSVLGLVLHYAIATLFAAISKYEVIGFDIFYNGFLPALSEG